VLTAESVSFVVVGSAALWLSGVSLPVGDLDVVPCLSPRALSTLCRTLGRYRLPQSGPPTPAAVLAAGIWSTQTAFGRIDVMVDTARAQGAELWSRSQLVSVLDTEVRVASEEDTWALRRHYKLSEPGRP
jgi:hypothetical protein